MRCLQPTASAGTGAAVLLLAVACGSHTQADPTSTQRSPIRVHLEPGHHTFQLGSSAGQLQPGDKVVCVTADGSPGGGGVVPTNGHGVGSSTGFVMQVAHRKVRVTCPSLVGNA
jgi:hypothetical protein